MLTLPLRTWICNAAAVFSGRYGAVQAQAEEAGCSRQTVYDHSQKVEQRLTEAQAAVQRLQAENARLRQQLARRTAAPDLVLPEARLRRFAVTAQAIGISLRQCEELLQALLPAAAVPDHSTLGRWTRAAARQAGVVLAVLDPVCRPAAETLCVDEIFFGGSRPWWPWNRAVGRCWCATAAATVRGRLGRRP